MAVLSVLLIVRALKKRDPSREDDPIWNRLRLFTVVLTLTYLFFLEKLGFIISTIIVEFLLCALYGRSLKPKQTGKALITQIILWAAISIITTTACYLLFDKVLQVLLPKFSLW